MLTTSSTSDGLKNRPLKYSAILSKAIVMVLSIGLPEVMTKIILEILHCIVIMNVISSVVQIQFN